MIRVGIIGFGTMGRVRYDAVRQNGHGRVVAVADPYLALDLPGVGMCKGAEELIADPEIDAVFICTPNYLNKPLTVQALEAGKHVFCEKPPAFSAKEVEEVIAVEQAAGGRKLMYGFNHRHHDSVKKAKELVDSGDTARAWIRAFTATGGLGGTSPAVAFSWIRGSTCWTCS